MIKYSFIQISYIVLQLFLFVVWLWSVHNINLGQSQDSFSTGKKYLCNEVMRLLREELNLANPDRVSPEFFPPDPEIKNTQTKPKACIKPFHRNYVKIVSF